MVRQLLTRSLPSSLEVREEEGKRHITGVIPYDSQSEDLGGFREVIRKGAFRKTLLEGDARCLWAHNTQYVLGRRSAGTLTFDDRDDGLHFDCTLPTCSWASDVYETVERRDAPGVSFGFYVIKDSWTRGEKKEPALRELLEVSLLEVSVGVAFPAYPASDSLSSTRDILGHAGIDMDKIAAALVRCGCNGNKCGEDDAETIRSAIASLQGLLPEKGKNESAGVESEPEESTRTKPEKSTWDARAREIELLEAESKIL